MLAGNRPPAWSKFDLLRSQRPSLSRLPTQPERLLRHPSFTLFWASRIFSSLGFQVASVAVGWLVYAKTGSAYALGLVGLFQFLPMVALTFLVGHIADRLDRRRIVVACQFVECIVLPLLGVSALCLSAAGSTMAFIKMERTPPKREPISFQSIFSGVSFMRSLD